MTSRGGREGHGKGAGVVKEREGEEIREIWRSRQGVKVPRERRVIETEEVDCNMVQNAIHID